MTDLITQLDQKYRFILDTPFHVSPGVAHMLAIISDNGGKGILVGGCVRDHVMGHVAKDIDVEVYGIDKDLLEKILSKYFSVMAVGRNFGIFKVIVGEDEHREVVDVALPRNENKQGIGHKGFVVESDPSMPFVRASSRRDFTINAMGIDVRTNEVLDPFGGLADIKARRLRHVSDAFSEDPLRVLRAAQFCARFDFVLDEETIALCQSLRDELATLSKERIYEEWKKLLLAPSPSVGLNVLRDVDALVIFPELAQLIGCQQDAEWHPEGDVWIHSLMVTDQAARLVRASDLDEEERLIIMAGALCHDLGKPSTTIEKDGRIKSPGHEQSGVEPTIKFLESIGFPKKWQDDVVSLVKEHLKPHQLYKKQDEVSDGALRRLSCRVNIDRLLFVSQADFLGRTTSDALSGHDPSAVWLKEKMIEVLGPDKAPRPILLGRHLIAAGQAPGTHFAAILRAAFEAQLDGAFNDEEGAFLWLKNWLKTQA